MGYIHCLIVVQHSLWCLAVPPWGCLVVALPSPKIQGGSFQTNKIFQCTTYICSFTPTLTKTFSLRYIATYLRTKRSNKYIITHLVLSHQQAFTYKHVSIRYYSHVNLTSSFQKLLFLPYFFTQQRIRKYQFGGRVSIRGILRCIGSCIYHRQPLTLNMLRWKVLIQI